VKYAAYAFWLFFFNDTATTEIYTDDTGVEVAFLLAITFILGLLHPRRAWQWALMVGPALPIADLITGTPAPKGLVLVLIAIGLVGAYAGALLRKAAVPA